MDYSNLVEQAFLAREHSYSPYSNFMVGAALLTKDGKVYQGCNVESATHTPTSCGERTAFVKAISEGDSMFKAIAIVGGLKGSKEYDYCYPCGVCRQVMLEFCDADFEVIVAKTPQDYKVHKLSEIIPFSFDKSSIK